MYTDRLENLETHNTYTVYSLQTYLPVKVCDSLNEAIDLVNHDDWLFCYDVED